ncbi:Rossmann-fold NAD(P)-binding domain-containing protein [Henriciella aquimarina]|uniref:hypothetical protein n=1 Tax=Henriciella aquimarina TaxID=545261 RepID=UPI000A05013D|nr:hypothetical protein [Henriciella aquimarina]
MSEHVLKLDPPAFGPERNFLPDAIYSEDTVMILSEGSESAQAIADAFTSVGASIVSIGKDMAAARRVSGIAEGHGQASLVATYRSDVTNVFDEVTETLGTIDHCIIVNVETDIATPFMEAFAAEKPAKGKARSAVAVTGAGKADAFLAAWPGGSRMNVVEASLDSGKNGPVGRAGGTFELGWAVAFLCSPFAREIDGQILKLDGGAS